ncbi:MAG: RnfABCDGE type electron transport complex subunit B [Clostridiaceae bacterium]|nr:RnfABCDGE type electron transport complex subunit B [Clostridiaceae bacterium]
MVLSIITNPIVLPAMIGAGIALLAGIVILLVFRFFSVEVEPLQKELEDVLPGANCGGCGYSGCAAYAAALASKSEIKTTLCTAGGQETATAVAVVLGVASGTVVPLVANVFCQGTVDNTHERYHYTGTFHCASASGLFSGPNSCTFGCLGFGDCVEACEFNALYLEDGIAKVNHNNCVACGKCVEACPKDLIRMIPKHELATNVTCSNHWPAKVVIKACKVGCIACGRCVRICPVNAIKIEDNLAVIDQEICIHCGQCVGVCPTKAIRQGLLDAPRDS